MKVVFLAAGTSIHSARWVNGLSAAGLEVHLVTQHPVTHALDPGVEVVQHPYRGTPGYLLMAPGVRRALRSIRPDLLNAHFASGYGLTARLARWHPCLLSVWGTDVYGFPAKSRFHHRLLQGNLMAADALASTSHCMAAQVRTVAPAVGEIAVTPFGVDMRSFEVVPALSAGAGDGDGLVIGTVKTMSHTYGVDTLVEAFALLRQQLAAMQHPLAEKVRLRLVGDGPQIEALRALCARLGLADRVTFTGPVPYEQVPAELAQLDIYVALSRQESFGVAVLEAGAAGRPVVVSDAGGLPEVVQDGVTGLVVPRENPAAAAGALLKLVTDPAQRIIMGEAGRRHVRERYAWDACVQTMISVYEDTIRKFHERESACSRP
jgi:glycosyltransferase involved in cell wall biosynthesis